MAGGLVANTGTATHINELIHPGAWYKNSRLVKLNLWILLLLITSSTNGYDGQYDASLGHGRPLNPPPTHRQYDERSPDPQAVE